MAKFQEHCEHSRNNLEFLSSFFLKNFNDWAITVMFYTFVHGVEAIFDKDNSIHSISHFERSNNLILLNKSSFPKTSYIALERESKKSRYKKYKIYDWEVHHNFINHFKKLVEWFNSQVGANESLDIQHCKKNDDEWFKKYQAKDTECNKCH